MRTLPLMKGESIKWRISSPAHTIALVNKSNMSPVEADINETFTNMREEVKQRHEGCVHSINVINGTINDALITYKREMRLLLMYRD